jgi:hypothetical protein
MKSLSVEPMALSIGRFFGVAAAIAGLLAVPIAAAAAPVQTTVVRTDDYPSWDDVNAAKQSESAKQTEITNITNLLAQQEADATARTNEALKLGNDYLVASGNLEAAKTTATNLEQRSADAAADAERIKQQVGALTAQLYKSGGDASVSLLLESNEADALLYRLGAMSQLTSQAAGLRDSAEIAANNASSLKDQAEVAATERDRLATAAQESFDAAKDARDSANALVAENKTHSTVLFQQLASLKNTTAQVEQAYQAGVDARAAEAARQAELKRIADQKAADDAAAAGSSSGSSSDSGGGGGGDSGGDGSSYVAEPGTFAGPDEAKDIAQRMLPSFGWGGDQFSCLVQLWTGESGWRVNAYNPDSGAYGIPQSWPANKMSSVADDWSTSATTQITWGLNYISDAYGSPCQAWNQWQARSPHWY